MQYGALGRDGPRVSALAFGLMGLSGAYGPAEDEESLATLERALDLGINFLDTADGYGAGDNERLAARILARRRDETVIATKFGLRFEHGRMLVNGRPENVRRSIDRSLKRLGVDHVDLYYLHRSDPDVPIEESVGAMGRLVDAGKILHVGLCAGSADTLRRACAEFPVSAVQSEYSILERAPEQGVLAACEELGVTFVAYSPLARGLLTGAIRSAELFGEADVRRHSPRLNGENLEHNLGLVDRLAELASAREIEPAQLALAWLLRRGVIPLFGTRRATRVESNLGALSVELDEDDLARIDEIAPVGAALGSSLPEAMEHPTEH